MLRAVVFDFDGVILESVDVKTRAFVALFGDWPEHEDAIVRLHLDNAGMSRFEKFRRIHREIVGLPLADEELERLGEQFSRLIREEMLTCDFVPGARELLERLSGEGLALFVASGTPEEELREIVEARGLGAYFTDVRGTPATKAEIIRDVLDEHGFAPEEVLMVGDALSDYEGARAWGARFARRLTTDGPIEFPSEGVEATVLDLHELAAWLSPAAR